uniref:WD and tetratricopeptide repeats protein 1 n=1 Tax=Timema shepardi TaxID=629360 RepID=A0A7R9AR91_TIMSH|nr:unnamed protein product [Timema shepardi]
MNRKQVLSSCNIVQLVKQREIKDCTSYRLQQGLHVTEDFVKRLGLEKELEGHNGCVNCLEWSQDGRILASASDDVQVILWDPLLHRKIHAIQTGHQGNIFSVKFLPQSGDSVLLTGAGDCRIRVHDVNLKETTHICSCHTGRVKRLATAPDVPYMFWSAAEDGTVMQFDLRTPHSCSREVNNVLVNLLSHMGRYAEAKCVAINPRRPELLAVGANDPYIRVYDRRMITPTTIQYPPENSLRSNWERQHYMASRAGEGESEVNMPLGCVQYYVAGHLPVKQQDYKKKYRNLASTYVTFSADGNELLVNLGEHSPSSNGFRSTADGFSSPSSCSNGVSLFSSSFPVTAADKKQPPLLPTRVEMLRLKANQAFDFQHFSTAIMLYNKAISLNGNTALLYGNRAAAYMKRAWDGDTYAAMRDCHTALHLDPAYVKAHFRLARCLLELQWVQEAEECLRSFKEKFPGHVHSHACKALCKDIQDAVTPSCDDGELPRDTRVVCELPRDTRVVCELPRYTRASYELPRDTGCVCHETLKLCLSCHETLGLCVSCHEILGLCVSCHEILELCVSCHETLRLCVSCHDTPGLCVSCHETPGLCVSCHETPGLCVSCHDTPGLRMSCHDTPGLRMSCHNTPGLRMSCHDTPGLRMSCHDTPGLCVSCHKTLGLCVSCHETLGLYDGELPRDSSECGSSDLQLKVQDSISQQERSWREAARDYKVRFCGHCNTTTDIKEANFFGSEGQYIVAGSDDGSFFIWDRKTTNIVRVLKGDDAIVNCLQPHPSSCLLATSGIDQVDGSKNDREVLDLDDAASANQKRMNADPFEVMLMNMGYRITSVHSEEGSETSGSEDAAINCRAS